ncbi:AfsR/SARP family transcriptional regulator [Nocardiopsis gilva YIM 90087]|uniref:AfsR/SARP family transcriptional regulator n=2 Tax=Nocardiopsis gilva TaxID=280236 RepID=A0A223SAI6_9ACTN|nr:BTAD domain-containing putative transcriptional regulator [Nocardiopsis gilva]ASU85144.1 AfsR/SARP family transcriptional regulator [Nocardiopsis gilva YIM 90087]
MADISFGVLGPLTAQVADVPFRLRGGKRRILLATLLLRANRTVPVEEIVERTWGPRPPASRIGALQVQVARLRAALAKIHDSPLITSVSSGYRIELASHQLDLLRFRELMLAAREAEHQGDLPRRCDALRQAVGLWRGPVLRDISSDTLHEHDVAQVREELLRATEERCAAEMALGRPGEVLDLLAAVTARHPEREELVRLRMTALYRCGRQSEALETYEKTRRVLADRLGVDPGRDLRETFHGVLRGNLEAPSVPRQRSARITAVRGQVWRGQRSVPAQLPADTHGFVGRAEELVELERRVGGGPRSAGRALISGPPGAGCTALAVHWAHGAARSFPDGQLYVDLRGEGEAPLSSGEVLRRFLSAFGMADGVPVDTDERAALLRSVLASRRVLMVLDNAHCAAQVRPLLPGSSSCGVIVTSRYWLADLIARDGMSALAVGALSEEEAVELLRDLIGPRRVAAEPGAVRRLTAAAERLPLAIRMAAAWLTTHPDNGIAALAEEIEARREADVVERVAAALGGDPRFLLGDPPPSGCAWRE